MGFLEDSSSLFQNKLFVLDLGSSSYKTKKKVRNTITENGGTISYILTKTSDFVIVGDSSGVQIDTYKSRKAQQLNIPVISEAFINDCVERNHLIDSDQYVVVGSTKTDNFNKGKIQVLEWNQEASKKVPKAKLTSLQINALVLKRFQSSAKCCPKFTDDYKVVKSVILEETKEVKHAANQKIFCVLELHICETPMPSQDNKTFTCRILEQTCGIKSGNDSMGEKQSYEYFFDSCSNAMIVMQCLVDKRIQQPSVKIIHKMPDLKLGSSKWRQMRDEMGASGGLLSPEVAKLVLGIATLAFGELKSGLSQENIWNVTPDMVTKAVVLLMKVRECLDQRKDTSVFSDKFYSLLSLAEPHEVIKDKRMLSRKQDFIQLLKDMMLLSEGSAVEMISSLTMSQPNNNKNGNNSSVLASLYKMLNCTIVCLDEDDLRYQEVIDLLQDVNSECLPPSFTVKNIFCIHRDVEDAHFMQSLQPSRLLFHASDPQNFIGILSRGLLLPLVVVSEHGGERSDIGMLGNAIYFADDAKTSIKYSKVNPASGTRLMLVNEVALGRCHHYNKHMPSLTCPPDGFDSVCGVGKSTDPASEFAANEYAVYNASQQRMRYLVEFMLEEDSTVSIDCPTTRLDDDVVKLEREKVTLDDVKNVKDPLEKVKPGLLIEKQGENEQIPLREVHVRAKMMDMVAEVVVMQAYVNESTVAVEAKYVFPLDDAAAVCGFEAFINGKHVVGKVKEKEVAHREYKAAVEAGHGAYLMDEEKADVFTVSVGNLPPGATVLIKITYVAELPVVSSADGTYDSIQFYLPGSVAPSIKQETLVSGPLTQTTVDRVTADGDHIRSTSLMVSVEMPFDIRRIDCPTHKVHLKKTATKACVRIPRKETLGSDGFRLLVSLAEIHVPRMWVERHPRISDSQACMVAFYPEFDAEPIFNYKAIIMLDMSQSMASKGPSNLEREAKKLALLILKNLPLHCYINVVRFGSSYEELFVLEQPIDENIIRDKAEEFLQTCSANFGASDVWRPLTSIADIQRLGGCDSRMTNIFLVSDGHLSEEQSLLQTSRMLGGGQGHSRIFSFSVGSSANQHLLKSMSGVSGGAHEHFSDDAKSKWEGKVVKQLNKASQPVLTDIRIEWKRYDEDKTVTIEDMPLQAPEKINSLFNSSRVVAYSFIPHCTQAELFANVCGKEISTVVSTSDLSIACGKTIHRLAARAMIQDYEEGMHEVDPLARDKLKTIRRPGIVNLSILHQVVSPYTSFVAVEEREENENLAKYDGPSIMELVAKEDMDLIPEIMWEDGIEDDVKISHECLKKELHMAEVSYYSSVAESMRHLVAVETMIKSLSEMDQRKAEIFLAATKSKIGMDVTLPDFDPHFACVITDACDRDVAEALGMIVSLRDVKDWKNCSLRKTEIESVIGHFVTALDIFNITHVDRTKIIKWAQYLQRMGFHDDICNSNSSCDDFGFEEDELFDSESFYTRMSYNADADQSFHMMMACADETSDESRDSRRSLCSSATTPSMDGMPVGLFGKAVELEESDETDSISENILETQSAYCPKSCPIMYHDATLSEPHETIKQFGANTPEISTGFSSGSSRSSFLHELKSPVDPLKRLERNAEWDRSSVAFGDGTPPVFTSNVRSLMSGTKKPSPMLDSVSKSTSQFEMFEQDSHRTARFGELPLSAPPPPSPALYAPPPPPPPQVTLSANKVRLSDKTIEPSSGFDAWQNRKFESPTSHQDSLFSVPAIPAMHIAHTAPQPVLLGRKAKKMQGVSEKGFAKREQNLTKSFSRTVGRPLKDTLVEQGGVSIDWCKADCKKKDEEDGASLRKHKMTLPQQSRKSERMLISPSNFGSPQRIVRSRRLGKALRASLAHDGLECEISQEANRGAEAFVRPPLPQCKLKSRSASVDRRYRYYTSKAYFDQSIEFSKPEGFTDLCNLLDSDTIHAFIEEMLNHQQATGCWFFAKDAFDWLIYERVWDHLEEVVKESGALSLGAKVYDIVWKMICTALLIEFFETAIKLGRIGARFMLKSLRSAREWLKKQDLETPFLYSRLELGKTWPDAAMNVYQKLMVLKDVKEWRTSKLEDKL